MKLLILLCLISVVKSDCDTDNSCLNSNVTKRFTNVDSFKEIKNNKLDLGDFGKGNINEILSRLSGRLGEELKGSSNLDSNFESYTEKDGTQVFVKTYIINGSPSDIGDKLFDGGILDTDINDSNKDKNENSTTIIHKLIVNETILNNISTEKTKPYNIGNKDGEIILSNKDNNESSRKNNHERIVNYTVSTERTILEKKIINNDGGFIDKHINVSNIDNNDNGKNVLNNTSTEKTIIEKNITDNKIPDKDYLTDDNSTDYLDINYLDLYKDTTNEVIEHTIEKIKDEKYSIKVKPNASNNTNKIKIKISNLVNACPAGTSNNVSTVFSWAAAIFIKNDDDEFEYLCNGAILSNNVIITAARCVNSTKAENIIVFLGKTSLTEVQSSEKIIRIKEIVIHENFTSTSNDLAILKTEEAIKTTDTISIACLDRRDEYSDAMTIGWAMPEGKLTAINFDKEMSKKCKKSGYICGVYGNDVTICPTFGGVFATKHDSWYLHGIRHTDEAISLYNTCDSTPLYYTPLKNYVKWIKQFL